MSVGTPADGRSCGLHEAHSLKEGDRRRARCVLHPRLHERLGAIDLGEATLLPGLPIGMGTDAAVICHGENAKELVLRVKPGEAPMATIVWATSLNARIIDWSDRVGFVMKGGVVYRDDLARR